MVELFLGLGLGPGRAPAPGAAPPRQTHVFVLGGQSNGTDIATWDSGADWPADVYQLERWTLPLVADMPGSGATEIAAGSAQIIAASRPLHHHYRTPAGGFGWSLDFAIGYRALFPGVDLVFIPCNWGGTGFAGGRWNPGDDLYADMVARTTAVMAAHPGWQLKGLLWHQGEADSTTATDADAHPARLEAMIAAFRTAVGAPELPVVCGGYVAPYAATRPLFLQTMAAQADLPNRLAYTGFAASDGTTGQSAEPIHFNAASMRVMGARYVSALSAAQGNAPTVPGEVTGLSAVAGDAQVTLNWSAPANGGAAITDYAIAVSTDAGTSWTVLADGVSTTLAYTHSGLSNGTAYLYRVAAINAVGQGSWSATAGATPAAATSAEAGAAGHWLFGSDNTGFTGLVGGALTEAGTAVTAQNTGYVSLEPANGEGLVSGLGETANMTMCMVVRVPSADSAWYNILMGNIKNGVGGQGLFQVPTSLRHNKYVSAGQISDSGVRSGGVWLFLASSLDASGSRLLYARKAGAATVVSSTVASLGIYASPIAIGPVYFTVSSYNDPFDVAEAIVFAAAKTQAELDAIYARSVSRLSARGIVLGS